MIVQVFSGIFTVAGLVFMALGIIGVLRLKDFYARILITAKVETVGFITMMIGVILYSGFTWFTLKVLLICLLVIFTNPLSTHAIAKSAYISGYKTKKGK